MDSNKNENKDEVIQDIESLKKERLAIQRQIGNKQKSNNELDAALHKKSNQLNQLSEEVNKTTAVKQEIQQFIDENNTIYQEIKTALPNLKSSKTSISNEISRTTKKKLELDKKLEEVNNTILQRGNELDKLSTELTKLNESIELGKKDFANSQKVMQALNVEKENLENNVIEWRKKNDLYTSDLEGISTDSKNQRNRYSLAATISFLISILIIYILLCTIKTQIIIPEVVRTVFKSNISLIFYLIVLMRVSFIATLIFVFLVFLNITRGFISQYIRTQEKMSSIRLIDFLISKIGSDKSNVSETQRLNHETQLMEKQNRILTEHLPKLIEYIPTSFDKMHSTENPITTIIKSISRKPKDEVSK